MQKENVQRPVSFRFFRIKLIAQLVGIASQTKVRQPAAPGRPKSQQFEKLSGRHFPSRIPSAKPNPKACVVCNSAMRQIDTTAGVKRRRPRRMFRIWSADCGVALCVEPCFQIYHTKQDYLLAYKRSRTEEQTMNMIKWLLFSLLTLIQRPIAGKISVLLVTFTGYQ